MVLPAASFRVIVSSSKITSTSTQLRFLGSMSLHLAFMTMGQLAGLSARNHSFDGRPLEMRATKAAINKIPIKHIAPAKSSTLVEDMVVASALESR